jgi:signal transduction histidine kinase
VDLRDNLLGGLFDNWRGRLRRVNASKVSVKIVAIVLIAVFIPSIVITALGLVALYRIEPAIQESSKFPFKLRLMDLRQKLIVEWDTRMHRYDERLAIETEVSRYLRDLTAFDPHVRRAFVLGPDGFELPEESSPLWLLEAPEANRDLSEIWPLEFQGKTIENYREARDRYARLVAESPPEVAVEAMTGLSRVEIALGNWREAIKVLARLHARFRYTVDEAGAPRGLAALWRIVEICREHDDPVAESTYLGELKNFLAEMRPWLSEDVLSYYQSRLPYTLAGASSRRDASITLPSSTEFDNEQLRNILAAELRKVPVDKNFGYIRVAGETETLIFAHFRTPDPARRVIFELDPAAYLGDAAIFTPQMGLPDPIVMSGGEHGSAVLGSEEDSNPPVSVAMPWPFHHLTVDYYRSPDEIPDLMRRLETQKATSVTWVIVALVLLIFLGILVTLRSIIYEMQVANIKSDFVSFVSHELKTPLTAIRMFSETLLLGRAGDRQGEKECVELIDHEASRLSRLIEQIIEFSKLEKHQQVFNFTSCSMSEVVEEAVRIFRDRTPDEEIDVNVHQAQRISRVRMDRESMIELILNLLSNAYKYSGETMRRIDVRMRESIGHISVDVVDYGVGIPKREQRKIFDKFYRAEDYLTRDIEGTGLGLTYAKYIAKVHNGDIKVSSAVDQGSTFTLEIRKNQVLAE